MSLASAIMPPAEVSAFHARTVLLNDRISHHCFLRLALEYGIGFRRLDNGRLVFVRSDVERLRGLLAARRQAPR